MGNEAYIEPVVEGDGYRFRVRLGKATDLAREKTGTKLAGANFTCLFPGLRFQATISRQAH